MGSAVNDGGLLEDPPFEVKFLMLVSPRMMSTVRDSSPDEDGSSAVVVEMLPRFQSCNRCACVR